MFTPKVPRTLKCLFLQRVKFFVCYATLAVVALIKNKNIHNQRRNGVVLNMNSSPFNKEGAFNAGRKY
jgi:hypothetical protein